MILFAYLFTGGLSLLVLYLLFMAAPWLGVWLVVILIGSIIGAVVYAGIH